MDADFLNLYVAKLLFHIDQYVKSALMNETKIEYIENGNRILHARILELEVELERIGKKKNKGVPVPALLVEGDSF